MPVAKGLLWFTPAEIQRIGHTPESLRAFFTVTPKKDDREKDEVEGIDPTDTAADGSVGVPLVGGVDLAGRTVEDRLSQGARPLVPVRLPDLKHAKAPPGQEAFTLDLLKACRENYAAVGAMKTGGGKTVSALYIAGVLGVSTLVIVPSNTLAAQWREEAIRHLGLPPESIGQIKSGAYPRNKPLVIAVVHNLFEPLLGDYGDQFGLVIADECHRMGAREFSKAAGRFASVYRIALTATPRRRDGCWPLVESFYGPVLVKAEDDDMETHCIQIDMDTELPERMDSAPLAVILKYLSRHKKRNADLAGNIIDLYRRGRRILVMSDRVEQLQCLQTLVRAAGIPGSETAFYTGFTWTNPEKRLGKVVIKEEQRKRIRDSRNLRIVFGTYAQMVEGVSIDWLDCGIDALPRADGAQMIGRIRRRLAGKPTPCWITPVDGRIALLKAFAMARLRTMAAEGVTIH